MRNERIKSILLRAAYILLICAAIYILFKYAIPLLMPFLLALCIGLLVRPMARFFKRKLKFPRRLVSVILVTILLVGVAALFLWIGSEAIDFAKVMVDRYNNQVVPFINEVVGRIKLYIHDWDPDLVAFIDSLIAQLNQSVVAKLGEISQGVLTGAAAQMPLLLVKLLFFIIASFFFAIDFESLRNMIAAAIPEDKFKKLVAFKHEFGRAVGHYVRSYAIIFCMTFVELLLGLLIIGVPNFALIAALTALLDILPVVGSGTVMLPWALFSFIRGDMSLGINLTILYVIITIIRQFVEPRVIGKSVGLHPLLTLCALYIGMRLFGAIGLIGLPVLLAVLAALERNGVTHFLPRRELIDKDESEKRTPWYKRKPKKEIKNNTSSENQ